VRRLRGAVLDTALVDEPTADVLPDVPGDADDHDASDERRDLF